MSKSSIEILEELKENDYELFIYKGLSVLSEDQWDFVINKFKMLTSFIYS